MNNNYNYKNIYKERNNKYIGAQSYANIIRQLRRERENKRQREINKIILYINSLNKNDYCQLEIICRQLLNANYKTSTTQQIIDLFKDAINIQIQYKKSTKTTPKTAQSNTQTTQSAPKTAQSNIQTTQSAPKIVQSNTQATQSAPKTAQLNAQTTQSSTQPSQQTQQSKQTNPITIIFNTLKSKLKLQHKPTQQQAQKTSVVAQPTMPKPTMAILDTKNRWSPISLTGKIYDFNRGVIGIDKNGQKYKIILDGTKRHHSDATAEIGIRTNCTIKNRNAGPFEIAIEIANKGVTIIQLEGNSMLIYLPDEMTHKQLESLKTETAPRKNFELSFTYKDYIYDNVNTDDLYTMCHNILPKEKVLTKAS